MSPEQFVAIIGAFTALLVAVGGVIVQVVQLRRQVDGRLTQLLELTATSSHAAGALDAQADVAVSKKTTPAADMPQNRT